ncbi:MAG TPA: M48 family metallopeptidase [Terriglobia bacterium]|nr:M48 family metallopeptidase [Terriglobia bacterium]
MNHSRVAAFALILALGAPAASNAFPSWSGAGQPAVEQTSPDRAQSAAANEAGKTTEIKSYSLPPKKYRQAVDYSRARYLLDFTDTLWGILVLIAVLGWRVAPRFRNWAQAASSQRRFVQALVYTPLMALTLAALSLPTAIAGHSISRHYQQSIEGWGAWFWDWSKGQIITVVASALLVWILYGIIRRSPQRWWFYFWLASIPLVVFVIFLSPLVIDPLFFKFEPLARTQPALVRELTHVVERAGMNIPRERMFEMKASEKLNSVNAYVTGVGASKRVVVWDTTIQRMTTDETVSVFGHEMGHYVLGHVWKGILFFAVLLLVLLYLGKRGLDWALARWGRRWDVRGADDWASLPVLLLLLSIFAFLSSPITNGFSRYQEHQADVYELEVIHGVIPDWRQVAVHAEQVLGEVDLADPDPNPLIEFWLYTHPSQKERIEFELSYDPWGKGEPPQFVK